MSEVGEVFEGIECLEFIYDFVEEHSRPPTIREMSAYFDANIKWACLKLRDLEDIGAIRRSGRNKSGYAITHYGCFLIREDPVKVFGMDQAVMSKKEPDRETAKGN